MLFYGFFVFSLPVCFVFGWSAWRLVENSAYMPVQGGLRAVAISFFIGVKYVFQHYLD